MNRVVVTGVGGVTPVGIGREEIWENINTVYQALALLQDLTQQILHVMLELRSKTFRLQIILIKKKLSVWTCLYSMRLPELKWLLRTQNLIWTVKTQLE